MKKYSCTIIQEFYELEGIISCLCLLIPQASRAVKEQLLKTIEVEHLRENRIITNTSGKLLETNELIISYQNAKIDT